MDVVDLDIETYGTVDLKRTNVYAYTEDPEFLVLMCGWGVNDGPIQIDDDPARVRSLFKEWTTDPGVKLVAHNAGFERVCLSRDLGMPVGEYLPPEQWFDTAAVARLHGLPASLDALAKALGLTPKDSAGTRLVNLFSKPHNGKRVLPSEKPEQWEEFLAYCGQDVGTMREARHKMGGWPADGFERNLWYADQRINDRGMRVDLDLAHAAVDAAKANTEETVREVIRLTGVENPGSTQQLGAWCETRGFPMPDWQADTVKDALTRSDVPGDVEQVLRLRQDLALVAHRKFEAALRGTSGDGRLRGQFMYHAAHTGRWSSNGVQVHNLAKLAFTRKGPDGEKVYDETAEAAAILDLLLGLGADPMTLKKLVRPMFLLDGVSSDLSAIEARTLAWIAGEDWVLQAFREGQDLYVGQAERMGGGMGRPDGKIAVLAGGYQGSVGSYRNMGYGGRRCGRDTMKARPGMSPEARAALEEHRDASHEAESARDPNHKDDTEILTLVRAYRATNPRIVEFWYDMERKFWTGGTVGVGLIRVEVLGTNRSIRKVHLTSGRALTYRGVHRQQVRVVDEETGEVRLRRQLAYRHVRGYVEKTYGGRLTENVNQAVARDVLADALVRMDRAGYAVVGHVHDEALVETLDAEGVTDIMRTGPVWAEGLPLDASGAVLARYRKD
jgi:DNA polymerase